MDFNIESIGLISAPMDSTGASDMDSGSNIAPLPVPPLPSLQDLAETTSFVGTGGFFGGSVTKLGGSNWLLDRFSRDSNSGPEDSQGNTAGDDAEINYAYGDQESLTTELSELYSYTECSLFSVYMGSYDQTFASWVADHSSVEADSDAFLEHLLDLCDCTDGKTRIRAVQTILYMLQGRFRHPSDHQPLSSARTSAFQLYRLGAYPTIVQLLLMQAEIAKNSTVSTDYDHEEYHHMGTLINIIYIMMELICRPEPLESESHTCLRAAFIDDLSTMTFGKKVLVGHVLDLFMRHACGTSRSYPLKKLLLLLWKLILYTCGGSDEIFERCNAVRVRFGLPPKKDNTIEVARRMRPSTPPLSASDIMEGGGKPRPRVLARYKGQQSKETEGGVSYWFSNVSESEEPPGLDENVNMEDKEDQIKEELEVKHIEHPNKRTDPHPESFTTRVESSGKGLPWTPKIRQSDIDQHVQQVRDKFVGMSLPSDNATLVGLPQPIEESINTMRRHLYVSLSELHVKREEAINLYPMSQKDDFLSETNAEMLYQIMLPQMGNYVIALLKVLLACSPNGKVKNETLNVVADLQSDRLPKSPMVNMLIAVDTARQKEIIVKAVTSTLLLLLKHFKVNHIYQFETLAQHLVMANCIALVLKFLNQNVNAYVFAKNDVSVLNYPNCRSSDLTKDDLENLTDQPNCWRNLHSCLNLVRILNKLAKWKRPRTLILVLFKSAAILKRALRVRHAVFQLYLLKALKLQSKFLGRQWRRANMRILSAIYEKVRHRFQDDWAYGNVPEQEVKRLDLQIDERKLRVVLDAFNNRRYHHVLKPNTPYIQPGLEEYQPIDNTLAGALSMRIHIPDYFQTNYQLWLEQEVFSKQIDWDQLLECKYVC